jgi:hypothetical protein
LPVLQQTQWPAGRAQAPLKPASVGRLNRQYGVSHETAHRQGHEPAGFTLKSK